MHTQSWVWYGVTVYPPTDQELLIIPGSVTGFQMPIRGSSGSPLGREAAYIFTWVVESETGWL